jgi:hypothetical protein
MGREEKPPLDVEPLMERLNQPGQRQSPRN